MADKALYLSAPSLDSKHEHLLDLLRHLAVKGDEPTGLSLLKVSGGDGLFNYCKWILIEKHMMLQSLARRMDGFGGLQVEKGT